MWKIKDKVPLEELEKYHIHQTNEIGISQHVFKDNKSLDYIKVTDKTRTLVVEHHVFKDSSSRLSDDLLKILYKLIKDDIIEWIPDKKTGLLPRLQGREWRENKDKMKFIKVITTTVSGHVKCLYEMDGVYYSHWLNNEEIEEMKGEAK